jgi:putative DNA primase/helicase
MSWVNYDEVINLLVSHDFVLSGLEIGKMQRVKRDGHKQKGWYVLHEVPLNDEGSSQTGLIGKFGYWVGGDSYSENISLDKKYNLDKSQLEAIKKRQREASKQAEAKRSADQAKAAQEASRVWSKYIDAGESDYLKRKGVGAYGLRFAPSGNGTVAVPMKDIDGRVWGLQVIRGKDRGKKLEKEYFPAGLAKKGHFHLIGVINRRTKLVLVAEGYATAATLHEATGLPVIVAFDAYNLDPVAEAVQKRYPKIKFLICADDDYLTDGNPGIKAAQTAALAVNGAYIKPLFPYDRQGKKLTDFNDLANFENCSNATVAAQIEDATLTLGWVIDGSASVAAAAKNQGGGERLKPLLDVSEAVNRYSLIYGGGGTMFDHDESMLVPKSDVLDICEDHVWRVWKLHEDRSVVRLSEVGFDPTEKDKNITCNLWGGWPTTPKPGQCDLLLDLLRRLCSGEEKENSDEIYQWVLKWLAYPIQHHGAKMRTSLIFHGPQGAGKNLFFESYGAIFGKYFRVIGQSEVDDKFNDWASGKLFMVADEVVARQELFHIKNKIKALITGETIRINPKNVAAHDERNHVNITFLSNETQPLVLEKDDRRFVVIWTPEKMGSNVYADIAEEANNGGIEALHDYLLHLELGEFNEHSKPPMTRAKENLININAESTEQFIDEWMTGELDLPICPCQSEHLYDAYVKWCKRNGVFRPREIRQFIGFIINLKGWERKRPLLYEDYRFSGSPKTQRRVIYPPPENYGEKYKDKTNKKEAVWVSECVLDFKNAKENKNSDEINH